MAIKINCPQCDAVLKLPDSAIDKTLRCPKCRNTFVADLGGAGDLEEMDTVAFPAQDDETSALAALAAVSEHGPTDAPPPVVPSPVPPPPQPQPDDRPEAEAAPAPPEPTPKPKVPSLLDPIEAEPEGQGEPEGRSAAAHDAAPAGRPPDEPAPEEAFAHSPVSIRELARVVDAAEDEALCVEILQYKGLSGGRAVRAAEALYYADQGQVRLKQVRLHLKDTRVLLRRGEIQFAAGRIDVATPEAGFGVDVCTGTGEIFGQPSFGHFIIRRLADESLIVSEGLFRCCQGGLTVAEAAAAFEDGPAQTKVSGTGVCVLWSPVPAAEIICCELSDETLRVEADLVLMRSDVESLTADLPPKGAAVTFSGTGKVWIAPSGSVYERLSHGGWA